LAGAAALGCRDASAPVTLMMRPNFRSRIRGRRPCVSRRAAFGQPSRSVGACQIDGDDVCRDRSRDLVPHALEEGATPAGEDQRGAFGGEPQRDGTSETDARAGDETDLPIQLQVHAVASLPAEALTLASDAEDSVVLTQRSNAQQTCRFIQLPVAHPLKELDSGSAPPVGRQPNSGLVAAPPQSGWQDALIVLRLYP
jgi:hypothetical protein